MFCYLFRGIRLSLALFWVLWITAHVSYSDVFIFQSSDNHSEYGNIPNYIRSTSKLAQDFLSQNPNDPVLHLVNGDLMGPSTYTLLHNGSDKGFLNLEVFDYLHQRYFVILNSGNHDYDYKGEYGIQLYLQQAHEFLRRANMRPRHTHASSPIRFNTANIIPTALAANLYQPHQELRSSTGKRAWVLGLLLDDFYKYSIYDLASPTQSIEQLRPMLHVTKEQILAAAEANIDAVIIHVHEQFLTVRTLLEDLHAWKTEAEKTNPKLARVRLPVAFAGHDHKVYDEEVSGTRLVDSGAAYAFSAVRLNDDFEPLAVTHYSPTDQEAYSSFSTLYPEEQLALEEVSAYLSVVEGRSKEQLTDATGRILQTTGFSTIRWNMQKSRQLLGSLVADAFASWAKVELAHQHLLESVDGVFSFYNSGSYRDTAPIMPGPITRSMAIRPYPLVGDAKLLILNGAQIQTLYSALRSFGVSKNNYTPQISSNLREVDGSLNHDLEHQVDFGVWRALAPQGRYALTLDLWLGLNGFKIPEFDQAFTGAQWVQTQLSEANEILLHYYPTVLDTHAQQCQRLLQ